MTSFGRSSLQCLNTPLISLRFLNVAHQLNFWILFIPQISNLTSKWYIRLYITNHEARKLHKRGHRVPPNQFRKLYIAIANQKLNPNTQTLKDQLASISRILVWDDQHNTDLFEYFPPHLVSSARSKC